MGKPFFPNGTLVCNNRLSYAINKEPTLPPGTGLCLDIGCGQVNLRHHLEKLGYEWVGLDISPSCKVTLLGDAHHLPFQARSLDAAYMNQVLEHLHDPWRAIREVSRCLRPGGLFGGSVSFLEPFHESYFHFTHWGIDTILRVCGLRPIFIEPGASVFLTLTRRLTGTHREWPALLLAHGVFRPAMATMLKLARLFHSEQREPNQAFGHPQLSERAPLTLAGHVRWLARKPETSSQEASP